MSGDGSGKEISCMKENVTYTISCRGCSQEGRTTLYTGETSRTLYQRGAEHLRDLENEHEDSSLWKHCTNMHGGTKVEFKMAIIQRHITAFNRQVQEAVLIHHGKRDHTLNSKKGIYG